MGGYGGPKHDKVKINKGKGQTERKKKLQLWAYIMLGHPKIIFFNYLPMPTLKT
jgi:hypothetical protein